VFWCQERLGPPLTPSTFDENGENVTVGDVCDDTNNELDSLRCPTGFGCVGTPSPTCVPSCDLRNPNIDSLCDTVVGAGAVCATTTSTIVGICGI